MVLFLVTSFSLPIPQRGNRRLEFGFLSSLSRVTILHRLIAERTVARVLGMQVALSIQV